jgi:GNAT superfamily N-acetyltransferase
MASDYALEPVERLSAHAAGEVRRIYEAGFPAHLRTSFRDLTTGRQPGELALALTQARQPCGFGMLRPLGGTGWIFLRYFVVDAARRGGGLGTVFWDQLTSWLGADGYTLLTFDVEDPAEPGCDRQEARIRSRRISFYLRQGASLLPVHGYRTPHGEAGHCDWTPMLLMAASLGAGQRVSAIPAGQIVAAVYRHRWLLAPDHPQVSDTVTAGQP